MVRFIAPSTSSAVLPISGTSLTVAVRYFHLSRTHFNSSMPASSSSSTSAGRSAFMGRATWIHRPSPADIEALAQDPLTHAVPASLSDYACIRAVRTLRWLADRFFRERYLHRAFLLKGLSSSAPTAAAAVLCVRETLGLQPWDHRLRARTTSTARHSPDPVGSSSHEATRGERSPFPSHATPAASSSSSSSSLLRQILSEAECHQSHFHMISRLGSKRLSRLEHAGLFVLQLVHFCLCVCLFAVAPRSGFRLLGYLLEESTVVMTHLINDVDMDKLPHGLRVPKASVVEFWGIAEEQFRFLEAPPLPSTTTEMTTESTPSTESSTTESGSSSAAVQSKDGGNTKNTTEVGTREEEAQETIVESQRSGAETKTKRALPTGRSVAGAGNVLNDTTDDNDTSGERRTVFTLREFALLMRSDEMFYRDQNHRLAELWDKDVSKSAFL